MKSIVIALFFLFIGFSFETDAAETPPTLTGKQTENYGLYADASLKAMVRGQVKKLDSGKL